MAVLNPLKVVLLNYPDDQVEELRQAGVHASFNFYNEAGLGFAGHAWMALEEKETVASS